MLLHGYWRSGASYRVRIALNLKGVPYRQATYDLRQAEHKNASYLQLQPQGLVPTLEAQGHVLFQSSAILEWIEERYPHAPLLPHQPSERGTVRAMAAIVACDIHPLNNLRVLKSLREDLGADEEQVSLWIARWISLGFEALEVLVEQHGDGFAYGDRPTMADVNLVPQIYSAERFGVDLSGFPRLVAAADAARALPAFADAAPEAQPDADRP